MRRVMIAIPCGNELDVNFVISLTELLQHPKPDDLMIDLEWEPGSLVYDARNILSQRAVMGNYDYVLWFDSDMSFQPDILDRMLESIEGRECVCGMFFSRRPPFRPTIYQNCDIDKAEDGEVVINFEQVKPIPEGIFEIAACGFAAVLIRTELLKEIFDKGGLPFSPMLGLGEDLSACVRFRELGHKLHCDSSIIVGHTAKVIVGGDDYRIAWNNTQ